MMILQPASAPANGDVRVLDLISHAPSVRRGVFKPSLGLLTDIARASAMSAAWDEMAAAAFTDETKYRSAKARFDILRSEGC